MNDLQEFGKESDENNGEKGATAAPIQFAEPHEAKQQAPSKNAGRVKILIIDDEEPIRRVLTKLLLLDGYEVLTAADGAEGLRVFEQATPDVVVSDIRMPKMDGLEVLKRIKEESLHTVVIMVTGHGDKSTSQDALKLGALNCFDKPVGYNELIRSIRRGLGLTEN